MLRLQKAQRVFLAEGLRDAANLAAGALVFGQFLDGNSFSWLLAGFGVVVWFALVGSAAALIGRSQS